MKVIWLFGNNARATIAHNLIINNDYAGILLVNARDMNVHHNVITGNLNGMVTQTRVSGGVHDNDIYGNTNFNAILNGTLTSSMFSDNWWGTNPTWVPEVPGVNYHRALYLVISGAPVGGGVHIIGMSIQFLPIGITVPER